MTELRLAPHSIRGGNVIEIWHDGEFIGQVTAAQPGVAGIRVISKHQMEVVTQATGVVPGVVEVHITRR